MGTTRIKVIDLSSDQKEIKTSRKHAEKLFGFAKIKEQKKTQKDQRTSKSQEQKIEKVQGPEDSDSSNQKIRELEKPESQKVEKPDSQKTTILDKQDKQPLNLPRSTTSQTHQNPTRHKGTKYQNVKKLVENKLYSAREALKLLAKASYTRFDPSVEIHLNVVDKNINATVNFPHPTSSKQKGKRYLIFSENSITNDEKHVIQGNEQTIEEIESGKLKPIKNFDIVLATPKFMPKIAKIAKILGPKGLMPNPKNGTIVEDATKYLEGKVANTNQIKTDPTAPIIHAKIGKLSQKQEELEENLKTLIFAVGPAKINKAIITSTMGPPIKLDITSLSA